MKIVNCILAVVILGLAITTIVFARTLDHKRYMIKARADKMKEQTRVLKQDYDQLLSIQIGEQVKDEHLHHNRTPADLNTAYAHLTEQFEKFKSYRELCVSSLGKMFNTLEVSSRFDVKKMNTRDQIAAARQEIVETAKKLTERDNKNIEACVQLAQSFQIQTTTEVFENRQDQIAATEAFNGISKGVDELWERIGAYETSINKLGSALASDRVDFSSRDFKDKIDPIKGNAEKIGSDIATYDNDIAQSKTDIETLNSEIKTLETNIAQERKGLSILEKNIKEGSSIIGIAVPTFSPLPETLSEQPPTAKIALNAPKDIDPPAVASWQDGDTPMLLPEVRAKVLGVSATEGFIIVDAGLETQLKQPGTENVATIAMPTGKFSMIVMRNGAKKPIFVGRATIARVEKDRTVLNIDSLPKMARGIAAGDEAIFTTDEAHTIAVTPPKKVEVITEIKLGDVDADALNASSKSKDTKPESLGEVLDDDVPEADADPEDSEI